MTVGSHFLLPVASSDLLQTQPAPPSLPVWGLCGATSWSSEMGAAADPSGCCQETRTLPLELGCVAQGHSSPLGSSQGGSMWPFSSNSSTAPSRLPLFVLPS